VLLLCLPHIAVRLLTPYTTKPLARRPGDLRCITRHTPLSFRQPGASLEGWLPLTRRDKIVAEAQERLLGADGALHPAEYTVTELALVETTDDDPTKVRNTASRGLCCGPVTRLSICWSCVSAAVMTQGTSGYALTLRGRHAAGALLGRAARQHSSATLHRAPASVLLTWFAFTDCSGRRCQPIRWHRRTRRAPPVHEQLAGLAHGRHGSSPPQL
jgi:hypothetical protein